jgi:hypothetical protein
MGFVLKEKLKRLKLRLRAWHKVEYGAREGNIDRSVGEIEVLDIKGEEVGLVGDEVLSRKEKFIDLWKLLRARHATWAQRSRANWLKDGVENTKFFHRCVKIRTSRNSIKALKVGDRWVQAPLEVKREMVDFFL